MDIMNRGSEVWQRLFSKQKVDKKREKKRVRKIRYLRPVIEYLEDRTLLSTSPGQLGAILAPGIANLALIAPQQLVPSTSSNAGISSVVNSAAATSVPTAVSLSSFAAYVASQPAAANVVIVDPAVANYQALINGIGGSLNDSSASTSNTAAAPVSLETTPSKAASLLRVSRIGTTDIVVLSAGAEGIQQITEILQPFHNLQSEQLLSHGAAGTLLLGGAVLNDSTLHQNQSQISAWGKALRPGGDILLYGCDVAQGSAGEQFVQNLARTIGAPVAANTQATGGTAFGGDWNLDYTTGSIQARPIFTAAADSSYHGVLGLGTDLKSYFQDLLASESASFTQTETIASASIGGFVQLNGVTLTENATLSTGGVWSGSVGISVTSATLFPGSSFSTAINSNVQNTPALTGVFTIGATGADFALSVPSTASMVTNVGEALAITASNVNFTYNSNTTTAQTLATIQTATVSSPQFASIPTATLSNFAIRTDGFSFGGLSLSSAAGSSPSIGSFLTASSVALTASNFNVSFGTTASPTPSLTGTVGVTLAGLQLYPIGNIVHLQSSSVTAAYNFGNFDGTDPTGQLTVTISGFQLTMGEALQLSAGTSNVVLTPDQPTLATIPSLTLTSPEFSGLGTFSVSNLQLLQTGFTVGTFDWSSSGAVTIGNGALQFNGVAGTTTPALTVSLSNFALQYGQIPSVSGSISFAGAGGVLFPNVPLLNISLGAVSGTFVFSSTSAGILNAQISNLDISLGDLLTIDLGSVDLTPAESTMFSASNVTVTANLFSGMSLTLPSFSLTQTGFSISGADFTTNSAVSIGNFLTIAGVAIDVNNFTLNTQDTPKFTASVTLTPGTMTLFPGSNLVTSTITGLTGSYDFSGANSTGQLSLSAGTVSLSLFNQVTLTANTVSFTPDQSTLTTIGTATLTLPTLSSLAVTVTGLAIQRTGFTIVSASATLASNLTLGGLLTLTTPSVSLANISYTVGGTLSGEVGFSGGASLQFGSALSASVASVSGGYNLATGVLSLALSTFGLNLAGFANVSASTVALLYTPQSGATQSEIQIGATGVEAFMGTGTGSGRVGVDLTGGTIASVIFNSAGTITYALDVTGTANILGLPANTISVTLGAVEFRKNTAGAVSTSVTVGSASVPLNFTANETDALATGFSISVSSFASITGDFGFSEFTASSHTYLAIGAENVTAAVSAGGVSVMAGGASLGLLIDTGTPSNYALVANGGTDSLTGVTGLTLSGTGLTVRVRQALDPSTLTLPTGVVTPDGTVNFDFSNLGSGTGNVTDVEGTATLAVTNFVSISGSFGFQQFSDGGATYLAVGASGVNVVLGNSTTNVTLSNVNVGLIVKPGINGAGATYALDATGSSATLNGVTDLTLRATSLLVLVRNGLDVSGDSNIPTSVQSPAGAVTLDFSGLGSGTTNVTDIEANATLAVNNFGSLTGDFGIQSYKDATTGAQQIAVGVTQLTAVLGTSTTNVTLTGASLGLVIVPGSTGTSATYALEATGGSASLNGITDLSLTATNLMVKAREGLDLSAASGLPVVQTSDGNITLNFSGLGSGTTNLFDVEGNVSLTVANFVTLSGAFGFQTYTNGLDTYLAVGMNGSITLSDGTDSLGLSNASIGVLVHQDHTGATTYALQANEGVNPALTTFHGPANLVLSASNLLVLADRGLDLTTYPSGVPTTIAVPAVTSPTTTETATPNFGAATTITLAHAVNQNTLVVTATPMGGGTPVTLTSGTDYTLGTDSNGNTKVQFLLTAGNFASANIQAAGTTITSTYTYTLQAANIALNFGSLPAHTTSVTEIEGSASFSVAGFASLSGDFGFELFKPLSGASTILIGATNVQAVLGTADTNVTFTGASLGVMIQSGKYALVANGSTVVLNGVSDLSFSASSLQVEVEHGLNPATVTGAPTSIPTPGGSVSLAPLATLGGTDVTEITGTASIAVANFISLAGTYSFSESTTNDTDGKGSTTKILVGATGITAFVGTSGVGVQITGADLGLVIIRDSEATGSTYALQASAPSIALLGLPSEISLTGAANVAINTTGAAINETIPGTTQTVSFASGANVKTFGGSLTLTIASDFTLTGDFSFTKAVSNNISKLLVGAANIAAPTLTADGGAGNFSLNNGTLGLVFYTNTTTNASLGYAMSASGTATVSGGGSSASVTLTILRNTTTSAQSDTVTVGTATIPVVFTDSQKGSGATAFQTIVVSNASLNIDNGLIITATSGTSTNPTPGASSTALTGVTLTLQDPTSSQVLFTISAGSATYTTFSATVTAGDATSNGLNARQDHQSWASGDKDLVLTNVTFTIGNYVSFSADSIDLQHYTSSGTVDAFRFTNVTLGLLNNGAPMVTLTGSPEFDYVTGSTPANNGFKLDPSSPPFTGFKFLDPTTSLGPITLKDPAIGLSNFSFALSGQLSATVTLSATTATIGTSSSPASATFSMLSGSFDLGLQFNLANLSQAPSFVLPNGGGFTITAAGTTTPTVTPGLTVKLGSYVTLTAQTVTINPTAGSNQDLISFSSTVSATLNVGSVSVTGTASNFAIEGNGAFLAKPGFGVSIALGQNDAGNLSWPSWLPLQSASIALVWPNFNADPSNFVIDLSAAVQTTIAGMTVSGSVTDAVIDPSLIAAGKFGITSISALAISVSGSLFGGSVSGTLVGGVVRFDSTGALVDGLGNLVGTTTPGVGPFTGAFYAGIEGGFNLADMAGFTIRVGLSQFGPLQVYVESNVPIPLGDTGLFISDFRGGITFGSSFPTINLSNPPVAADALQLRGAAFTTPDNLTAAQWEAQLRTQVANQVHSGQTGGFSFPTQGPFIIQAGLTLYDVNPDVFNISGDVFFDTTGNFLVIGTATIGDSFSVGVKVYANLAPLFAGQSSLNILYLTQVPAQPNSQNLPAIYQIYGFISFSDINNVFKITIAGEADFNVLNGVQAEVTATVALTFTADSFNITISDGTLTIPTIQTSPLGTADGSITVENANGTIEIWGGLLLTTNLTALNPEGIYSSAQVYLKLNTTDQVQTVTLSNGTLSLDPESVSFFLNGVATFEVNSQPVFELSGTLAFQISTSNLTIFVQAQLLLGPNANSPILAFNANGLIDVEYPTAHRSGGFAAKMALTMGLNTPLPTGITFGENWLLAMNTTGRTITYTLPNPVATNPPSPPIPTVLGPDYSSTNPLALTSYETITNGARTLVIPAGAPAGDLSNYSNWTPVNTNPYFLVLGRGTVNILNVYVLTGNLNILATESSSGVSFLLDVNATETVKLNGNTVFSYAVAGGIQFSSTGVAAGACRKLVVRFLLAERPRFWPKRHLRAGTQYIQHSSYNRWHHATRRRRFDSGHGRPDILRKRRRPSRHVRYHCLDDEFDGRSRRQCYFHGCDIYGRRVCCNLLRLEPRSRAQYQSGSSGRGSRYCPD